MKLIDRIVSLEDWEVRTRAVARSTWPTFEAAAVDSVLAVELVAQSAAALPIWRKQDRYNPGHLGFVVGVKSIRFGEPSVPVDSILTTTVSCPHLLDHPGEYFGVFHGTVNRDTHLVAEVALQIVSPKGDVVLDDYLVEYQFEADPASGPDKPSEIQPGRIWTDPSSDHSKLFRAEWRLDPSLPWFDGHFPKRPLLPGVALLYMVKRAWGDSGQTGRVLGFRKVKFKRMVLPGSNLELIVHKSAIDRDAHPAFEITSSNNNISRGSIVTG